MEHVIINGVDIEALKKLVSEGYSPSSATITALVNCVLEQHKGQEELINTMRDALEDAEYQLSLFADYDPEDVDAHNAHAKVQAALKESKITHKSLD